MMREAIIEIMVLLPIFVFNSLLAVWLHRKRQQRREVKFLKQLAIHYPEGTAISFMSVETSDKRALDMIMEQWATHEAEEA